MDITKLDVTILIASTMAVILMSLTMPQLGLAGDAASESEVPEFEIEPDRFDLSGDFPQRPTVPDEGYLTFSPAEDVNDNQRWLSGDTDGGQAVTAYFTDPSDVNSTNVTVNLADWDTGSATTTTGYLNEEGDTETLSQTQDGDEWDVQFTLEELNDVNTTEIEGVVHFDIISEPADQTRWYQRIPVVGTAVEAGQALGSILAWLGSIVLWFFAVIYDMLVNTIGVVFDVTTFFVGLLSWLVGTYVDLTTASELAAWANVLLTIPGIMMAYAWSKVIAVLVNIIWIG